MTIGEPLVGAADQHGLSKFERVVGTVSVHLGQTGFEARKATNWELAASVLNPSTIPGSWS